MKFFDLEESQLITLSNIERKNREKLDEAACDEVYFGIGS